jgi:dipeptidyl aminopeptidase/acylaminoacyl peptidase
MPRTCLLAALILVWPAVSNPQAPLATPPPDTEIVLAPLTSAAGGALSVGRGVNITRSPGYDNQPSFTPDGRSIFFTSIRGGTQTDIFRYDVAQQVAVRVTDTPESEYSATVTPDGAHISVIRVEAGGTQRLWRFTLDGQQPELVLERVKPVGYHAWIDEHTLALFVLGQPSTLQLADTRTGNAEEIARGISRSIQRIPNKDAISFVDRDEDGSLMVRQLEAKTKMVTTLTSAVAGAKEADLAWAPDGTLLMADKDVLYGWRPTATTWRRLADLAALGMRGVTRIAVSPKGDRIAFVTQAPKENP